ncbi:MAG TPA: glutaredoxin domain-containing protein [Ktedonobacterales bacterium]
MSRDDIAPAQQSQRLDCGDIVMYSTAWCGDCRRAKRVFAALEVPYHEIDIEEDSAARQLVQHMNDGMNRVPTILFPDGGYLAEPHTAALESRLREYLTDCAATSANGR